MGMGGGQKQTTDSIKEIRLPPWVEQASQENYQRAQQVANRPYVANPYETYAAPLDPMYYSARKDVGSLNDYDQYYQQVASGLSPLLSYNPADIQASTVGVESLAGKDLSPYLNPYIDNVERTTSDATMRAGLQEQSRIASDATKKGSLGGTRQAVQQGVASSETLRKVGQDAAALRSAGFQQAQQAAIGDITREYEAAKQRGDWAQAAQIASRMHDLQAHEQAIAAGRQITDTSTAGQQAKMNEIAAKLGIGQMAQEQKQLVSDKKQGAWQKKRDYPLEQLNILMAALGMSPYGHTEIGSETTRSSGGGGGLGQALGAGLSIGKMLLPMLSASDPKMKTNIEPVGEVGGVPWYAYDYKADVNRSKKHKMPMGPKRVGPMAGDVPFVQLKGKQGRKIIDLTQMAGAL